MLLHTLRRPILSPPLRLRLAQTMAHISNGATDRNSSGVSLKDLNKSNNFTCKLPADPEYPTPLDSHQAPREDLGPRMVKGALYTYVRPEEKEGHELLAVSPAAMRDLGLHEGEAKTEDFQELVSGNRMMGWDEKTGEGVYPWAQCYGGWQLYAQIFAVLRPQLIKMQRIVGRPTGRRRKSHRQ